MSVVSLLYSLGLERRWDDRCLMRGPFLCGTKAREAAGCIQEGCVKYTERYIA